MADDILDLPREEWGDEPQDAGNVPVVAGGGATVRTMNGNLGAIRVDVKRSLPAVRRQIMELAAMVGEGWEYALPFKKRNKRTGEETVELVRGPSIRCTTAIARAWGNTSVEAVVTSETNSAYYIDGIFMDIENGFRLSRPFRQRKDQNIGSMGGDRGRVEDVVFQIGVSKAQRNAVRNALPDICELALEEARQNLSAKIERNKPAVLAKVLARLEEFGVPLERVERFYQVKLNAEVSSKVLAQVVRMLQAVVDQLVAPADLWKAEDAPKDGGPLKETDEPRDDEPKGEPDPKTQADPKPEPKPEPKPAADPKPAPQDPPPAEAKPAPVANPAPAPAANPAPAAADADGDDDDDEGGQQAPVTAPAEPTPPEVPSEQPAVKAKGKSKGKSSGGLFIE